MTHKRVCGNRARRIVNFRRFDVAGVSAFSCGGRGEKAGLSQRSKSTKFRGFICPSRMKRERELGYTRAQYPAKLENIYEASRKMNEKSVAKAL